MPGSTNAGYGRGVTLALLGVVLISFEALILRLVDTDVWTVIWWRGVLLCFTVVSALLFVKRSTPNPFVIGFPAVMAVISFVGSVFCFVGAVNLTTAANTLVIASAAPALAAFFSWLLLGERASRSTWLAAGMLFVGITVILLGTLSTKNLYGDLFALAYAAWLANYFVALRSSRTDELFPIVAYGGFLSAVAATPMAAPLSVTIDDFVLLASLGVLVLPVSILLLAFGTRYMPAADVVLIMMLEALLGPLWVWLVLEEVPSDYTIAGGIVILTTVVAHAYAELADKEHGHRAGWPTVRR